MTQLRSPDELTLDGVFDTEDRIPGRIGREIRRALVDASSVAPAEIPSVVGNTTDRVALFTPVITATRLMTTAICCITAAIGAESRNTLTVVVGILIIAYNAFRAFRPIQYNSDIASMIRVVLELALHVGALTATGCWNSPFLFSLITPIIIAGFSRGFAFSIRVSVTAAVAVSGAHLLTEFSADGVRLCALWGSVMFVMALVSGYGRRVSGVADRERTIALDRLGRLADANALLYSLHRVAQTLPASLDMSEVLDSTISRLRGLIDFDVLTIMLFDETDGHWQVLRTEGCHLPARIGPTDLPFGMRQAITESRVVSIGNLGEATNTTGFGDNSGSGLYGVLTTRGAIMGLIALEHRGRNRFDHRAGGLLSGFVPPLALAMDNARWFARLRTVGADEERTRIARDVHDRIGQSLAYLAFEMDRIVSRNNEGNDVSEPLAEFRGEIRNVIGEVRDTLYDLRTDVSETQGFVETMAEYLQRVEQRTSITTELKIESDDRLPFLQEREVWRIAQEAITNIERHANATSIMVIWRCENGRSALRVIDNGIGFENGRSGRLDSYGMLGMRERAASIGATLEFESTPGRGTTVTCIVDPSQPTHRPN